MAWTVFILENLIIRVQYNSGGDEVPLFKFSVL